MPARRVWLALLCLPGLLLIGALPVLAINATRLELGTLQGEGWRADGLQLQVNLLDDRHARIQLQAESARLPAPLGELTGLQLDCAAAELTAERFDCRDGMLQLQSVQYGAQQVRASVGYRFVDKQLTFELVGIRFQGGRLALH
ncbi:MAG TPA: hypothetical protein VET88_05285, partial [Gammaproteobacteria bacterium]|nr:hypothetical protein [Gammaproteobacteria bacterium]